MDIKLFTPHKGQKKIINGFADSEHKYGIVSTGRQFGKSLLAQNLLLYWALKQPDSKCVWIAPVYNQCKKIFQELTNAAHKIIAQQNKADLTITFINGSTIQFLSTDNYNSIRGFSFHYMVVDEAAFIKEEAMNEAVFPTLTALGKKCLIISTPKSKNWFYNYYMRGLAQNNVYISFKGISHDNPYVDENFIVEQQKSLPPEIYRQEYLAEFTDAGNDVFTNLENVCIRNTWDEPTRNRRYYSGIDVGVTNDYSVLTIMDESGRVCKIVRINSTPYEEIARIFVNELKRYSVHGGYVEANGIGFPMYELIRKEIPKIKAFYTNNDNKVNGIRNLIYKVQNMSIELPSKDLFPELYNELTAFTYKQSPTGLIQFNAPSGIHDDCVMSLMLANTALTEMPGKGNIHISGINSGKRSAF
jgi:phage FluMu gp28-like protein